MDKLKAFIVPILLLLVSLYGAYSGITGITEKHNECNVVKADIDTKKGSVQEKEAKLADLQRKEAEEKKREEENKSSQKPFYKPVETGLDTEAVINGEFSEILRLIQANKIKVRSIKYDYNPKDDNFVNGAPESYNVSRLTMDMISNYSDYDNFLKELHKHEHFLDIDSVEIVPYKKNKKILLVQLKLKLYAKK